MKGIPFAAVVFACGLWMGSRLVAAEPATPPAPASPPASAAATNAALPSTLPELQTLLTRVTGDLGKLKQELTRQAAEMRSRQRTDAGAVSSISTQDVEVVKIQKRMAEIDAERAALAAELQKRVESLPAYQALMAQQKTAMENSMRLREQERELTRERFRIVAEIERLQRLERGGEMGATNGPAVRTEGATPALAPPP